MKKTRSKCAKPQTKGKGYRMSCGGKVKRYAKGGQPKDIGARPDMPPAEMMRPNPSAQQLKKTQRAEQSRDSSKMAPQDIQKLKNMLKQQMMDKQMKEAAGRPPQQRGYARGGMANMRGPKGMSTAQKRMLLSKLMRG